MTNRCVIRRHRLYACAQATPHRLAELYIALGGSADSQWQHVVLPVTSSATPLTKEGNKHPSRRDERRGEKEREVGGRGRENLTHLNLPDTKDNATKTRLTLDREKRNAAGTWDPRPFFFCQDKTATFPVVSRETSSIFSRWWSWIIFRFLNKDEFSLSR